MLAPPKDRFELLCTGRRFEVFVPQNPHSLHNFNDYYIKHWYLNDDNSRINQRKNIQAVQQLCADLHIPFVAHTAEEYMFFNPNEPDIWARDYMHGGPRVQKNIADRFIQQHGVQVHS
jgi:hypothetical protein